MNSTSVFLIAVGIVVLMNLYSVWCADNESFTDTSDPSDPSDPAQPHPIVIEDDVVMKGNLEVSGNLHLANGARVDGAVSMGDGAGGNVEVKNVKDANGVNTLRIKLSDGATSSVEVVDSANTPLYHFGADNMRVERAVAFNQGVGAGAVTMDSATIANNLTAKGGVFSDNINAKGGVFSDNINAAGAIFSGNVQAADVSSTNFSANAVTATTLQGDTVESQLFRYRA